MIDLILRFIAYLYRADVEFFLTTTFAVVVMTWMLGL
jgi:hypothetical protein